MAQTAQRMNHIFQPDGKTFIMAMDHGSNFNVLPAMKNPGKLIREIASAGVAMGRNIWGNDDPVHYAAAIAKLIHENCSVDAALKEMGKA